MPNDLVAIGELIANLGVAGLTIVMLKKVYSDWSRDKKAWETERIAVRIECRECQRAHQTDFTALQNRLAETIERLKREQAESVEAVQNEKDEIAKNNTEMLIGLVPKLEIIAGIEKWLEDRRSRDG